MGNGFYLGIETSWEITGIAIVKATTVLYELRFLTGSKHNETIFQILADALKLVGIGVKDLAGIGVSIGPGMFTSLRVGLALAKGLSLPYKIPVKGINTLDALADYCSFAKTDFGLIVPIVDARKDEVFTALYRNRTRISEYAILSPARLAQEIAKNYPDEPITFLGNGAIKYEPILASRLREFNSIPLMAPLPSTIAFKAQTCIRSGDWSDVATLQPFYLRPTDAELKRK
ncbi:MAG: tRNA (adenosine(37)-N6)-threonylcarbamoyltransferase complex dimerization subunit type 1 TsaB [candidate division WOR-3 bacterium]